ncbi:MAG: pyruvate kinase [Anaerolineaceae bacterium 4572_5.2]|nr:MAG: pyruvate kinase [Anaerolineaceae bacterium 4572_5.2]
MKRRAKIVATLGPASSDELTIKKLLQAGMNVARLNFSHGTREGHAKVIKRLRKASQELDMPLAILQDLSGPKIRTGEMKTVPVELKDGQPLTITTHKITGDARKISVTYSLLPQSVYVGGKILLDDGKLELEVTDINEDEVETKVVVGGLLKPHKGVNLPGADLELQTLTQKDRADLKFGLDQEVDAIALSFVRSADDIRRLRQEIARLAPSQAQKTIIAKLEHPDAIDNLHQIIHAADGVMVARGDLGIEMPPETVPIVQKKIISMANKHLRYVITATQMLDSMVKNPRPTRAEASDVANAILDGSDAVMLSGETAIGKYPIKTVKMMSAIIRQSESHIKDWGHPDVAPAADISNDDASAITRAARELASDQDVEAIAVFTQSGRTARLMSSARPTVPILAFTSNEKTYRRLAMLWGTTPYITPHVDTLEDMLTHVEAAVVAGTPVKPGQEIVLIAGFPINQMIPPNLALLHKISKR